ncbi:type I-E CRISPR-associated protein Cas7/Cse4/CasC [Actinomadura spongiicola]|uniref:Type I-E CRISPR-associated protein Cas7/Cse4/CasC n=1 Tax=Actinomadura spongiicola TaxID=2303421 RepID=A0A372G7N4_9ACTN|nr:type I-E CRISPR-associated protein Cas7/Cse4/CasC [Actinomadura spongiicola]RFS81371.1 type I-E CRISPR-associated protein Cas7/Cse4/CasC [Actinomadura spongiicola]
MKTPKYLDVHILQTLPYSNVNRDDLGSPKTLVYGGTPRTRVSSQAWKRPVRLMVEDDLGEPTARTRRVPGHVSERLQQRGWPRELADAAGKQILRSAGEKETGLKYEKDGSSAALFYLPTSALDDLADLAEEYRDAIAAEAGNKKPAAVLPKARLHELITERNASINLFGRMLAEIPGAGVDGNVQFAHAFTTHGTDPEIDFFTAVDDLNQADQHGSGHMNSAEFSAGVFYRYACLDLTGLMRGLAAPQASGTSAADHTYAAQLTSAFLTAFLSALPSGKQNSTAANTLPDLAYLAVRSDRPISLAPAFESPVRAESDGWAAPSFRRLADHSTKIRRLWGTSEIVFDGYAGVEDKPLTGLGTAVDSYPELITSAVGAAFPEAQA